MHSRSRRPSRRAGWTIGVGLGAFVDGILLHQVVHWHQMLSARVPPTSMDAMQVNMRADGLFHLAAWCIVLLGVFLLRADAWRDAHGSSPLPTTREFTGQMLAGWGLFNLVEGIIDHHLLELHHVRDIPRHVPELDWIFLAVGGVGFLLVGISLSRRAPFRR
jgi:uncharacterized membrane protein